MRVQADFEIAVVLKEEERGDLDTTVPKTITQALDHEDAEYWKAAILDEIINHEEIFKVFGPPIDTARIQHESNTDQILVLQESSVGPRIRTILK